MKKIIAALLSACMILSLTACTQQPKQSEPPMPHEIKNIILIIGDGFGMEHIEAAELAAGKQAVYRSWPNCLSNTNNYHDALTDSAAGGTALATGVLTGGGIVGQDTSGKELKTIMDYAAEMGKATGVVSTEGLAGATPATFTAHTDDRENYTDIMIDQFRSGVRLLCGQQTQNALNLSNKHNYTYTVCKTIDEVNAKMNADMAYWQLDLQEDLTMAIEPSLRYLDQDEDGFVLMIEQAHIDKHSHANDFENVLRCVKDLNETVDIILNWIGDRTDTAVIITADHETGGLKVSTEQTYFDPYTAENGTVINYFFGTDKHTSTPVGVFVYGFTPDFEQYYMEGTSNIIKNTSIFSIMLDLLQNPMKT